jgi:hypothetical protein
VKPDPHVHTTFSGRTTIYPFPLIMNESYNSPEERFDQALLFDLVKRPAMRLPEAA